MKIYACLAVALAAVASSGRTFYHVNCAGANNYWYYYDENGVSKTGAQVESDKGEYDIWISRMSNGNRAYNATLSPYMFRIDGTNVTTSMTGPWCDGGGVMTIGAGGVTMGANNMIRFGNKTSGNPFVRFKLAESQTWSGPASGTVWSEFAIGCREYYNGYYWQTCAQALKDLTWTLDGRIKVILTATNDLSNVDVVVNPMARLILVEKYSNQTFGGALGAKTLTLKGGDTGSTIPALTIGGRANPSTTAVGNTTSPVAFSDITVAPKVYLQDGAAVEGGNVEYSVGELFVSGGDSTFSGNVAVKKNVVIDVASGASITFSGAVTSDDGAAIDATGQGTIAFTASTLDAALTGGGAISFSPTSGECVLRGDLSAFTGTVYVASGSLLIHPRAIVNPAATFTAAAGASYKNIEDSELGADFLLDGRDYYRDLNGEPHPYLYTRSVTSNANWPATGFFYYISPDGVTTNWVNWADGSVVCFEHRLSAGLGSQAPMHLCGLVRRAGSGATTTYFDASDSVNGVFSIGERGIEFCREGQGIYFWKNGKCLQLSESQTWKAPASDSFTGNHCRIYLGGSWTYIYPTGSLVPTKDDLMLTLEGNLLVSMYYPSNDFSRANITVKSPALLHTTTPGGRDDNYKNIYGRLNAKTLTLDGGVGMYFGSKQLVSTGVGSAPIISPTNVARRIILKNGATLTAAASTTWTGTELSVADGSAGGMSGTFVLQDEAIPLSVGAGATLDMTGALFKQAVGVDAGFSATGTGKVRVSFDNLLAIDGNFTVNGPAVEIVGNGRWSVPLSSASGLSVDSTGVVSVDDEALAGFDGDILVTSGNLVLESAASIPAGRKVVTSGTGMLVLLDWTGFDAETHMGGTKSYGSDGMVVTDEARENEDIVVGSGQTLHVFGSGLKASSTAKFLGGSSLLFHKSAKIYAPVQFTNGTVTVTSAYGAEGEFAGAARMFSGTCDFYADGGLVFAGGFSKTGGAFNQRRGSIIFKNTNSSFVSDVNMYDGRLCITNCKLSISKGSWHMDLSAQTGDVEVEIAKGGEWALGNSGIPFIGRSNNYESRLVINGGTMSHGTYDKICMDDNGTGKALIEFNSGTILTERRIWSAHDMSSSDGYAKFIWRGGTMKTTVGYGYPFKFNHLFYGQQEGAGVEFRIEGTNCVLDLNGFVYPNAFSNFTSSASRMIGTPGAVLTIKGMSGYENKMTLLGFEPNGMALDLNKTPHVDVEVVGEGDPLELGWVVPGANCGTVSCIGTASPLLADYFVPAGGVFENSMVNDDWHSGFSSATANSLLFSNGSTYRVYTSGSGFVPLSIAGSVVLPSSATLVVDKSAATIPVGENQPLVSAAGGAEGECEWTINGAIRRCTRVHAGEGGLMLDYTPTRSLLIIY